jgi:hypothetical protein
MMIRLNGHRDTHVRRRGKLPQVDAACSCDRRKLLDDAFKYCFELQGLNHPDLHVLAIRLRTAENVASGLFQDKPLRVVFKLYVRLFDDLGI